jgi:hypothetical protein
MFKKLLSPQVYTFETDLSSQKSIFSAPRPALGGGTLPTGSSSGSGNNNNNNNNNNNLNYILLENGFYLLQENGSKIYL